MQGYALAAHCKYQIPFSRIVCAHFYPRSNKFVSVTYKISYITQYIKYFLNDVWEIRKAKKTSLTPRLNQFCDWCDYSYACPKGKCPSGMSNQIISENKIIRTDKDKQSSKERTKLTENIIFTPDLF